MARWGPASLEAEGAAIRRLIAARPEEYNRLLEETRGEVPQEPSESCACLGATALELADLLGHDRQGHQVHRALWSNQIRSVEELLRVLNEDVGLYHLHGQGLGRGGLARIHDRVRRLGVPAVGAPAAVTERPGTSTEPTRPS